MEGGREEGKEVEGGGDGGLRGREGGVRREEVEGGGGGRRRVRRWRGR